MLSPPPHFHILGLRVDATGYAQAATQVTTWARKGVACYVCVANVHMVMEAYDNAAYRRLVNHSALTTPDGMPLVWALRHLGRITATRVYGPDLTLRVCQEAETAGLSIGLYGGTPESLAAFKAFLKERFPRLRVACAIAPPFRPLTDEEDRRYTKQLAASGAHVVFVGIGCPKQERWMAEHTDRLPSVLVGVGAAFDFFTGRVRQAPHWMQRAGLEWAFRLAMEPRRLWKRYARHNPRFALLVGYQWYRSWKPRIRSLASSARNEAERT